MTDKYQQRIHQYVYTIFNPISHNLHLQNKTFGIIQQIAIIDLFVMIRKKFQEKRNDIQNLLSSPKILLQTRNIKDHAKMVEKKHTPRSVSHWNGPQPSYRVGDKLVLRVQLTLIPMKTKIMNLHEFIIDRHKNKKVTTINSKHK